MGDSARPAGASRGATRLGLAFLFTLGLAAPLRAQTYLAPNIGLPFGGDTRHDAKVSYGGTLTFAGDVVGFTVDFAYLPDFFAGTDLRDNDVTTLMGNLVLLTPGHTRLYGSAGLGLLKSRVGSASDLFDVDTSQLGFNAGGGLLVAPGPVGLQADVRYYRTLTHPETPGGFDVDLGSLSFWRASVGLVFRF